jgi:hypothetical protein
MIDCLSDCHRQLPLCYLQMRHRIRKPSLGIRRRTKLSTRSVGFHSISRHRSVSALIIEHHIVISYCEYCIFNHDIACSWFLRIYCAIFPIHFEVPFVSSTICLVFILNNHFIRVPHTSNGVAYRDASSSESRSTTVIAKKVFSSPPFTAESSAGIPSQLRC